MKIEISKLNKAYGQHVIFKDLNEVIKDQSFCLVKGKSGTGKSTLLNMIGGLEPYDSGEILYDGKALKDLKSFYRNQVSFVFQNFALIDNETVLDNLKIVYRLNSLNKKERDEEISLALKKVGLDEKILKQKVYELSGGEKQRVALAKVLLKKAGLILADEPTASLDKQSARIVLETFKKLHENHVTIIIVTHSDIFDDLATQTINI